MKRILILAILIASTALAFSNGKDEAGTTQSSVTVNKTGYPIASGPLSYDVTAIQFNWGRNWGEMPLFQQYAELTGVDINWTMIPESERVEKTNLMLATASYPDVFMGRGGLGNKTDETILEGVIMPLNDLLEEWAPNTMKYFEEIPEIKSGATYPDGNIYGFTSYNNGTYHGKIQSKLFFNSTWLNNLGLDMPETTDEFYDMLKAFKEQDPNGNGKADEIPFALYTDNQGRIEKWITYFGPWGVVDELMVEDGDVIWGFEKDGFKEATKFYRTLVEDGLMDMESIAQTRDQMRARAIVDGDVVLGSSLSLAPQFLWNDMSIVFKYDDTYRDVPSMDDLIPSPTRQIDVIPPLEGPNGDRLWRFQSGIGMTFGVTYIFKDCPVPEGMVRWMDYWYDGETNGYSMLAGPEGIRWERNPETGAYSELMPPPDSDMNLQELRFYHTPVNGSYYNRNKSIKKPVMPRHVMLEEYTDVYLAHIPEESFPANLTKSLEPEVDLVNQYEEELLNYVYESMAKFIFDMDTNVDAEWPAFLDQCKKMKSKELLEAHQAQYDRFLLTQN